MPCKSSLRPIAAGAAFCVAPGIGAQTQEVTRPVAATAPFPVEDFASEATWADKYRDGNHRRDHYEATKRWHFVEKASTSTPFFRPHSACVIRR
jgi:hypothetical protein